MFPPGIVLGALALSIPIAAQATAGPSPTVQVRPYHGWADCIWLGNGIVELVVVPQIGRILRYGFVGKANVLFENAALQGRMHADAWNGADWLNFGGDKLWPAPQSVWGFPPDPQIDGRPQQVEILPGPRVRLVSQASESYGIRFEREIALDRAGAGITITNTMRNVSSTPRTWGVWQITQLADPTVAVMPRSRTGRMPAGFHVIQPPEKGAVQADRNEVRFRRSPRVPGKIGGDARGGWLAADVGADRFTCSTAVEPNATYCDGGCPLEIWSNPDPLKYMELELLGPVRTLGPGETATLVVRWNLRRAGRPSAAKTGRRPTPRR